MSLINQVGARLDVPTLLGGGSDGVTPPPFADLSTLGSGLLAAIFGSHLASIVETLASSADMPTESALSLLSLLTSIVLGVLGREVSTQHLGAASLASLLERQRDEIESFVPRELGELLTASPAPSPTITPVAAAAPPPSPASTSPPESAAAAAAARATARPPRRAWIVPGAVVAILALAGWYYLRPQALEERRAAAFSPPTASSEATPTSAPKVSEPAASSAPAAPVASVSTPASPSSTAPPAKTERAPEADVSRPLARPLRIEEGNANFELNKFLSQGEAGGELPKTFTFERLSFESNSAELMDRSDHMVAELADILRAHPTAAVRIEAHTDSHGNAAKNKALTLARANAIKAKLVAGGIAASRVTTEGAGGGQPIASNDTAAGRRHNRRVTVVVLQR
jgi:OmpA-OmpF porin, OOP family